MSINEDHIAPPTETPLDTQDERAIKLNSLREALIEGEKSGFCDGPIDLAELNMEIDELCQSSAEK